MWNTSRGVDLWLTGRVIDPLVGFIGCKVCASVIVVVNILRISAREHKHNKRYHWHPFSTFHYTFLLLRERLREVDNPFLSWGLDLSLIGFCL